MGRRVPPPQYEHVTDGVRIRVRPKFMHDESEPARARFMWSYTVDVENESEQTWTIVRRHWRIVDAEGRRQEVDGDGVIGQTPTLDDLLEAAASRSSLPPPTRDVWSARKKIKNVTK